MTNNKMYKDIYKELITYSQSNKNNKSYDNTFLSPI